jgi:glucose/arabinose dehydrogenase
LRLFKALQYFALGLLLSPFLFTPAQARACSSTALRVKTPDSWCLEVKVRSLKFPRGVYADESGFVWVVEMGGWQPNLGRVLRYDPRANSALATQVWVSQLDRPHTITKGPDGKLYVGVVGGIVRLPEQANGSIAWIVGGNSGVAGPHGTGMHPLTHFVFDTDQNLIVNAGAKSNICETQAEKTTVCNEEMTDPPSGALLKYVIQWPSARAQKPTVLARGLRNSMALAVHPTGTILQADNARDAIHLADPKLADEQLPHDEINLIQANQHYGWPYCFDRNRVSPEYLRSSVAQCPKRKAPLLLLPPHAASLGMTYDSANRLPAPFTGQLLVAMHGYRAGGHRVRSFAVDKRGLPIGYGKNAIDIIDKWERVGSQSTGAPVDLSIATDGSIWITDDRNGQLLQLTTKPLEARAR